MYKLRTERPRVCPEMAEFPRITIANLAMEPCLLSNSPVGVRAQGGGLAKIALAHVEKVYASDIKRAEKAGLSAVVDVRVQRLMVGMYPSIPGWHCDAVPRNSYHGQPNFAAVDPAAFHVCVLLSSEPNGVSNTQFLDQNMEVKLWVEPDRTIYKQLHEEVEKKPHDVLNVRDGQFVKFSPKTVHRAMPTHRRGWRMFFRYSMYHKPPVENAIPAHQQVYILSEANGW